MNLSDIKNHLLCHGIRIDESVKTDIININPYFFEKDFSHCSSIILEKTKLVNIPILDKFMKSSPFLLTKIEDDYVLLKNGTNICKCKIPEAPSWYDKEVSDGIKAVDILREHNKNIISCNPFRECIYFSNRFKCKFCSYGKENDYVLQLADDVNLFIKAIKYAFYYNPNYEINFSIGTWPAPDRGALKIISLINELKKDIEPRYISLEMAPPKDIVYINELKKVGISSVMFNLEIYDPKIRKKICPGKSKIGIEEYVNAWNESVNVFGKWRVGSVLIAGLEPKENTIKGIDMLLNIGVLPIIMPFKPLDESMLSKKKTCSLNDINAIQRYIRKIILSNYEIQRVFNEKGLGCLSCSGCSI